jgi:hypothetical protein
MAINSDEVARGAAVDLAHRLVPIWQSALGPQLLGVYLIGSLCHGGFSRRYSDIDTAFVTTAGLSTQAIDRIKHQAAARSADWGAKVSVFWTDRHFSIGRFPPLDRIDFLERPVVLLERERIRPERPTLDEIRHYLCGAPFTNWAERARQFATAETFAPADRKAYLRALLYPARFCYSYLTGGMASNDDAVAYLNERRPAGLDLSSIRDALQCRQAAADPDALFSARTILPAQVAASAALFA